ncbi:MAG: hypothetical protein LC780_07135 [Acidobacteria bacterium]|nr:hypothetical protein [Acidobacteriota bacterium]
MTPRRGVLPLAIAGLLLLTGCASRARPRQFALSGPEQAVRAAAAWRQAVARSETLGAARLLYDARIRQGIGSLSGTLAVSTDPVGATITGPFGATLATYSDGALRGEKFPPVAIEPEPLLWLLAGVWKGEAPEVKGFDGDDALLAWSGAVRAEAVVNVPAARFTSLRIERGGKVLEAAYPGTADPWPSRLEIKDVSSGSTLRLTLVGREPSR